MCVREKEKTHLALTPLFTDVEKTVQNPKLRVPMSEEHTYENRYARICGHRIHVEDDHSSGLMKLHSTRSKSPQSTEEAPSSNFHHIRDFSVCVVGIGGIGAFTCEILARSGIGKLILLDYSEVQMAHCAHLFFAPEHTGMSKLQVVLWLP